jgi:hypothetical protein
MAAKIATSPEGSIKRADDRTCRNDDRRSRESGSFHGFEAATRGSAAAKSAAARGGCRGKHENMSSLLDRVEDRGEVLEGGDCTSLPARVAGIMRTYCYIRFLITSCVHERRMRIVLFIAFRSPVQDILPTRGRRRGV